MGAALSTIEPRYASIWHKLSSIESDSSRLAMVDTLLESQEFINVAKRTGVYGEVLQWTAAIRRGTYHPWPTGGFSQQQQQARPALTAQRQQPTLRITDGRQQQQQQQPNPSTALARIPPPKRALDVLHESYRILDINDSKPLSHEALRSYYKKAVMKTHPDKGGNPQAFDDVTRAFLYLQEVLEKLIPKTATDGSDPRFTAPVTPDSALAARGITKTAAAPAGSPQLEDRPPVALNPKKLDMTVFNKLFEENKLPDPDKDDGYGDWLKSQENTGMSATVTMRGKYNADIFNKTFEDEARKLSKAENQLSSYKQPSEMTLAPHFGTELGAARPDQYTKAPSASGGIGYTDLKYAYGEGSTFSQGVAGATLEGRPKNLEEAKREYGSAPTPLSAQESAAVQSFERAREDAEAKRRARLAARDVDTEQAHARIQRRMMIQN